MSRSVRLSSSPASPFRVSRAARGLPLVVLLILAAVPAAAKTVICIDARNERYNTSAEGYYRSHYPTPPHEIRVGGDLSDCMTHVADGDTLIIVSHGENVAGNLGGVFQFGGTTYPGFGTGSGVPVPGDPPAQPFHLTPAFLQRRNIFIQLVMCWSAYDPDNTGPRRSSVKSLETAFPGGSGVTVGGFLGTAGFPIKPVLTGGSATQRKQADDELKRRTDWMDNPPANRPNAATTQRTAAQAIVDELFPTKGIMVSDILYPDPVAGPPPPPEPGDAPIVADIVECGEVIYLNADVPVPALGWFVILALLALGVGGVARLRRTTLRTSPC